MPTLVWIAFGVGAWTFCALLAVAVACAARRGDRLSSSALLGVDPSMELAPRPRMAVDITPVARPWVATRSPEIVASVLAESV